MFNALSAPITKASHSQIKASPSLSRVWLLALVSLLPACHSVPVSEPPVMPLAPAEATPAPLSAQQLAINALLSEADYCLAQNKLLNPLADNAHDRYRSVLLLQPDNERAKLGLQAIALKYLEQARTAAKRGNLTQAQSLLKTAQGIDNNVLVQEAAVALRKQLVNVPETRAYQAAAGEVILDAKMVQAKDPQITKQLTAVAQQAKQLDQFVLIIARTDAEGRWLYQQLRSSVPGYLVRGDIKLGAPVRVKLVATLE